MRISNAYFYVMKINTGATVNTLKDEPYTIDGKPLTVGQVIAEALAVDKTGGKMKLYALADRCFKNESVEVDAADLSLMKRAVEESTAYNNIVNGQVLVALENARDTAAE